MVFADLSQTTKIYIKLIKAQAFKVTYYQRVHDSLHQSYALAITA